MIDTLASLALMLASQRWLYPVDNVVTGIKPEKNATLHLSKGEGCVNKKTIGGLLNRISSCNSSFSPVCFQLLAETEIKYFFSLEMYFILQHVPDNQLTLLFLD